MSSELPGGAAGGTPGTVAAAPPRLVTRSVRVRNTLRPAAGALLALAVLVIALSLTHPEFLGAENIRNVLGTNASLLVVSAGMTAVLISGGIDLSVGAVMAVSQLMLAGFLHLGMPGWLGIVLVLAAGFAIGALVNGLLIGVAKLNFFVVTLASMTFGYGVVDVLTNGSTTIISSPLLSALGNDLLLGIPVPAVIFVVLLAAIAVVLQRTAFGRAVFSVGGNAEAARLAGIPIPAVVIVVYGISGLCAALGGVIEAGRFMAATPTTGSTIALTSVAAVLLGGTSLKGGTGGLTGTVAGVLVIGVLGNGVDLLGVSSYWQGIVTGAVLVAAVALDRFQHLGSGRRGRLMRKYPD